MQGNCDLKCLIKKCSLLVNEFFSVCASEIILHVILTLKFNQIGVMYIVKGIVKVSSQAKKLKLMLGLQK